MPPFKDLDGLLFQPGFSFIYHCPYGLEGYVLGQLVHSHGRPCLYIAPNPKGLSQLKTWLSFYCPELPLLLFPPFDQEPYDRLSPKGTLLAQRVHTLLKAGELTAQGLPFILATTLDALVQKVPPSSFFEGRSCTLKKGECYAFKQLNSFFEKEGYHQVDIVQESPEYAMRGNLIDVYSPSLDAPVRLDFFGDELQSLTPFDPLTQRRLGASIETLHLTPTHEIRLDPEAIAQFRRQYRELFGAQSAQDHFYETISQGIPSPGYENWSPLFHPTMVGLWTYAPSLFVAMHDSVRPMIPSVYERIEDHYHGRCQAMTSSRKPHRTFQEEVYRPLPPEALYWTKGILETFFDTHPTFIMTKAPPPLGEKNPSTSVDMKTVPLASWATVRNTLRIQTTSLSESFYKGLCNHIKGLIPSSNPLILSVSSSWGQEFFGKMFQEYDLPIPCPITHFSQTTSGDSLIYVACLPLEEGFKSPMGAFITEKDLLGGPLRSKLPQKSSTQRLLEEFQSFSQGDYVVHEQHGIARFERLLPITIDGISHDCLELTYAQNDRLFVPVENMDVLSRYGSDGSEALLDKLGTSQWTRRKEKLKEKLQETAQKLMHIAAVRHQTEAPRFDVDKSRYEAFCDRFPYEETVDQLRTADEVVADFQKPIPMDRLVCGDVGFGKTEIALRAAFLAMSSGYQVALVSPTTLLAHQHFDTFSQRFHGLGFCLEELSRLVPSRMAQKIREGVGSGQVNCLISTHSGLSKSLVFHNLGLLIIDEEQHFGVEQKERLKAQFPGLHILTLSATPIPRTLQMALSGVRDLSLITTPPPDRLSVKTTVMPYDSVMVKEALLREHYRGGQSFFVTPRIDDLNSISRHLKELVPELTVGVAHGQLPSTQLDAIMSGFYSRSYDILLATNIIESGLDVPTANTMIIAKADRFGLSQLYQLRGRIGRSKKRGFAYLTYEQGKILTKDAEKRLDVFNHLEQLGGGFTIASHDMDIRGAGNLIGEEQSGHIKEVGIELYQHLLKEAIEALRKPKPLEEAMRESLTAQISWSAPIFIPQSYVSDLDSRLALYHRISRLKTPEEIHHFGMELTDRFGPLPDSVNNLFEVIALKRLAEKAHIEKVDIGSAAIVFSFFKNLFPNPAGLVDLLTKAQGSLVLRSDHKLVYKKGWASSFQQIENLKEILLIFGKLCKEAK